MSLFKLHRINNPEVNKLLKAREMRLERTINLYRFFLFVMISVGDTVIMYLLGELKRQYFFAFILITIFVFSILFGIHHLTRTKDHKPLLKYATVTIDLTFILVIFLKTAEFTASLSSITIEELLIFSTIFLIFFNFLSALRIKKYVIYYSTLLALIYNFIIQFSFDNDLVVIYYTSFFIIISGFFNLWISNFILQSFLSNTRLSSAMNDIKQANEEITAQRDQIVQQNKRIKDSITYARRIQNAVLPQKEEVDEVVPDNFIFYWPKDIVSGDFYWIRNVEVFTKKYTIVSVVDCTGHGVPGAFMSMLGTSFLNEIVLEFYTELKASEILDRLREQVIKHLHQSKDKTSIRDGMDLSLCVIDYEDMKMQFSGAYNPLYLIRNPQKNVENEIEEIKGDKMPIGIYFREEKPFTNHVVDINNGDIFYLFSDGYADQFGGDSRKKFNLTKFREILLRNCHLPMEEQKSELEYEMKNWMGDISQIDDITIVGVKI